MDTTSSLVTAAAATPSPSGRTTTDFTAQLAPHLPQLRRFALRLARNPHDAEDLLQDVLLKLFERPERMNEVEALQPWLMRVMYHQFIDRCRRDHAQADLVSLDEALEQEPADAFSGDLSTQLQTEDLINRLQVSSAVHHAIAGLPEQMQLLVRLHDLEGRSLPELSVRLGISINTLKSSLSRARVRLRSALRPRGSANARPGVRRRSGPDASWVGAMPAPDEFRAPLQDHRSAR